MIKRGVEVAGAALLVAAVAWACGSATKGGGGSTARGAGGAADYCQPDSWTERETKSVRQYYRLIFEFMSCLPEDIPISFDVGMRGGGIPLSGAKAKVDDPSIGGALSGASVLFSATGEQPSSLPTEIPHGGISSWGSPVDLVTIPYWDGDMPVSQGPCATTNRWSQKLTGRTLPNNNCADDPADRPDDGTAVPPSNVLAQGIPSFSGSWAIYLPTATLQARLLGQVPFPMAKEFKNSPDPSEYPGAVATGILLERVQPGGEVVPLFSAESAPATSTQPGASPPDSSFIESMGCADNLVVVNGNNKDRKKSSDWATMVDSGRGPTPSSQAAYVTTNTTFEGLAPVSSLLFVTGWISTERGTYSTIPLGDAGNSLISRKSHAFRAYLRYLDSPDCSSGSGGSHSRGIAMVGGSIARLKAGNATLAKLLLANSTLRDPDLSNAVSNDGGSMAYTRIVVSNSGGSPGVASLTGSDLSGTNLTGAELSTASGLLNLQGARAYYADLSRTDITSGSTTDFELLVCGTSRPPDGTHSIPWIDNRDCATAPSQAAPWLDSTDGSLSVQQGFSSPGGCDEKVCGYVSIYNNTTRTLTKGLSACDGGDSGAAPTASQVLGPLDSTSMAWIRGHQVGRANVINCSVTYSNGPWGKVVVHVKNVNSAGDIGPITATVDGGSCNAVVVAQCLPKAAPTQVPGGGSESPTPTPATIDGALWPPARLVQVGQGLVRQPVSVYVQVRPSRRIGLRGTFVDVILCEPEAFTNGTCKRTPALPTYELPSTARPTRDNVDQMNGIGSEDHE